MWKVKKYSKRGYCIINSIGMRMGAYYTKDGCNILINLINPHTVSYESENLIDTFGDNWSEVKERFMNEEINYRIHVFS